MKHPNSLGPQRPISPVFLRILTGFIISVVILSDATATVRPILPNPYPAKSRSFYESNYLGFLVDRQIKNPHTQNRTLYFNPNVETFARDAEYFLPYTKGYTSLGFTLNPSFTYRLDQHLKATVGIHLTGIAGDHKTLREIMPIVRIEYEPAYWVRFVGGTLYGNLCHDLYEPMFGFDRYFLSNQEMGLQAFFRTRHWKSEIWCNWEDFIILNSPFQEKFTFGWSNRFMIAPDRNVHMEIPLQLMMNHRGGQFTSLTDTCLETLANIATGVELHIESRRTLTKIEIPIFGCSNRSDGNHIHTHYKDGWGIYPQVSVQNGHPKHHWSATIGYWYGHKYFAGRGSYLFQSRSFFDESFERRNRNMITFKGNYCLNKILGMEFQAYYDTDEPGADYAFGIYLFFDKVFKIHTFKK